MHVGSTHVSANDTVLQSPISTITSQIFLPTSSEATPRSILGYRNLISQERQALEELRINMNLEIQLSQGIKDTLDGYNNLLQQGEDIYSNSSEREGFSFLPSELIVIDEINSTVNQDTSGDIFSLPINSRESLRLLLDAFKLYIVPFQEKYQISEQKIRSYEMSLSELEEVYNKTEIAYELYLSGVVRKVSYFVIAFFVIWLFSFLASAFIMRKNTLSEEKQLVLTSLLRLIRNFAIAITAILFFFSEFSRFLPALAIIGTGIGFALRDVISSFIAWFVIGLKDTTFKIGDIIEIPRDNIFGQVTKIHPLVTTIKELGMSGPNSKFRSFPNKMIFETSLNNLSRHHNWIYIPIECMLTYESRIVDAKQLLLETMNEVLYSTDFTHPEDQKARIKKSGIPEEQIIPQVFVDVRTQGVFLRGKMLVQWSERHEVRNRVVQLFSEKVQKTKHVELRYVDFWINELR